MGKLILLRHGQSDWNLENRFAGWSDDPPLLTERGKADAKVTAGYLQGIQFDMAFSSKLKRAHQTLNIVLEETGQTGIPITYNIGLNERHYGDLQGLNRAEMVEKYGMDQVMKWRRGYSDRPPNGESIADCVARVTPYFETDILPQVYAGKTVLVVAHGNSIRPILKYLDNLNEEETAKIEIPLCTPYIFTFEGKKVVKREVLDIPGIVTAGGSLTQSTVKEGRV